MFILVFEPQKWTSRKCKSAVERRKAWLFQSPKNIFSLEETLPLTNMTIY